MSDLLALLKEARRWLLTITEMSPQEEARLSKLIIEIEMALAKPPPGYRIVDGKLQRAIQGYQTPDGQSFVTRWEDVAEPEPEPGREFRIGWNAAVAQIKAAAIAAQIEAARITQEDK